jgi:molybdopterin-containing oxidoreductase family membrane subunit
VNGAGILAVLRRRLPPALAAGAVAGVLITVADAARRLPGGQRPTQRQGGVADTRAISGLPLARFGMAWWLALLASAGGVALLAVAIAVLLWQGTGVWGTNVPHVWGFDLINYVWWIGVANAASLFAVILVLRRHGLRTAVNRFAEAAALASVVAAGLYPILHLGRPWLFYWVFPYPATTQLWPQFRSTLIWDFWGITSHVLVTGLFWYIGLIPDLATMRERAAARGRRALALLYGLSALGWRGSMAHWARHQVAYRLVAALLLPLLLAAQTVVALEFATTLVPDWHQARLPLHVVVTGLPSGLGIVLALAALLRQGLGLRREIDDGDMRLLSRLTAAAATACLWIYAEELLFGLVLEGPETRAAMAVRAFGPYALAYWAGVVLTALLPLLLWSDRIGRGAWTAVPIGLLAAAGVWLDRFSLVVAGAAEANLPVARPLYAPSFWEWGLFAGTIALFAFLMLVFARLLPVVSMFELRHEETESPAT